MTGGDEDGPSIYAIVDDTALFLTANALIARITGLAPDDPVRHGASGMLAEVLDEMERRDLPTGHERDAVRGGGG